MKKSMLFKRICAGLLAALMVVGSDPVTVLADEPAEILEEAELILDESEEVLLSEADESVIENQTIVGANGEEIPTEEALAEEISAEDISVEGTLIDEVSVDETLSEETLTDETSAEDAEADSDEENEADDEDMELMATYSITISTKNIAKVTYVVASDITDVKGSDVIDKTVVFNDLDDNPALNEPLVISGIKPGYDVAITDIVRAGSDVLYDMPTYDGGTGPSSEKTKIGKRGSSDLFGWLVAKNVQDTSTGGRSIVSEYKAYDVKVKTNNVGAYVFVYYTDGDLETTGDPEATDFKEDVLNSDSVKIYSAELSGVENVAHVPAGKKLAVAAIPKWMTYGTTSVEYPQDGLLLEKQESNKLYSYVDTFLGEPENADIAERCNLYQEGFGLYEIGTIEHGSNPEVKITVTDISYDVTLSTKNNLVDSITYMLADTASVTVSNTDDRIRTLSHSDNPNPFKTYTDSSLGFKEYVTINVPKGKYLYIVDLGLPTGYSHFKDMSAWNYEDATYVEKFYTEHGKYTDDTRFEAFAFGSVNKPLHVVLNNDYYCMDVIKSVYGVTTALEFAGGYTKESESGKDVYRVVAVDPDSTATPPVDFGYENLWVKAGFGRFSLEKVKVQARAFYNKEGAGGRNERVYSDWMKLTFQSDLGDNTALFYLSGEEITKWSTKSVKELVEGSEDPNYYTSIELRVMPTVTIDFNTKEDSTEVYLFNMDTKKIVDYNMEDERPLTPIPEKDGRTLFDVDYAGNFAFVVQPKLDIINHYDVESVKVKKGSYDKLNYWEQDGTDDEPSKYKYYQISNVTSDIVINSTLFVKEGSVCCFTIDNSDCVGAPKISVTNAKFVQNNSGENLYQISQSNSQTKVTEVTVNIEAQKAYPFDLLMGSGDNWDTYSTIAPVETKDLPGNWTKYTFKFRAKDLCDPSNDKRLYLKEHPEERAFYLTFNKRETKAKVVLTSTGVELAYDYSYTDSALGGNYKVYKYWIPYMYEVAVTAEARENCKLTTGVNNKKNVNINKAAGKAVTYKYVAKDGNNSNGNDFAFYSTSLNVLRVFPDIEDVAKPKYTTMQLYDDNFLKYPKNSYTAKVEAEDAGYYAYIDHGEPGHADYSYFDFGEDDVVVKAVTAGKTEVSNEMIKYLKIVDGAQVGTLLHFDFSSEKVAGQTVTVTVTKAGTKIATLKFTVAPYAQTVTIKGEKNKTVSQEYLTSKTYKLTFNKGVNTEHTAIIPEYYGYDNKWYQFPEPAKVDENYFIYDAKKAELTVKAVPGIDQRQDPDALKNNDLPGFRVMVYDITKPSYKSHTGDEGRVDYKYFNLTLNNLAKYTPKAKVTQTSDVSVTVDFNLPSQYKDYARSMYYDVIVKSTTKNVDLPLDRQVNYVIPATEKGATLMVAHGEDHKYTAEIKEGQGHAQKYDVTVKLMCGRDYWEEDDTISVGNYPYGNVADADKDTLSSPNYVSRRWYGSSKNQAIKNVSTKDPYYENALTAKAGTTKILRGQKNVKVATVKFNKKTSYHDTYCVLLPKDATSDDIMTEYDFHECFTSYNKNDIILSGYSTEHGVISPGEYKLLIYPYDGETIPFAYSKPAVVNLTIYQSLVDGLFDVSTPSTVYKKDNASASMTPTITYSATDAEGVKYEPKVKKFTWELDVSKIPEKMQKYVKINKSTGKVTIDKKFEVSATPAENTFQVVAYANDYEGNTAYACTGFITISNVPNVITSLTLVDKFNVYKTDGLNKTYSGTKNDFGKIVPSGIAYYDATFTSSNKKVMEIDSYGELTVKSTGKTVITVKSKDGSKSTAKMTLKVVNKGYEELGLGIGIKDAFTELSTTTVNEESSNSFILSVGFYDGASWIVGKAAENTSYSISAKGGTIKKIAADVCENDSTNWGSGHTYVAAFTSDRMTITLTDKTKSKKNPNYKKVYVVELKDMKYATNKKIKASFTKSSVGPDSETYLKITGLDKSTVGYGVALIPDMFEYGCSSYAKQEAYYKFQDSIDTTKGMKLGEWIDLSYNPSIGGFVPYSDGNFKPISIKDYDSWFKENDVPVGTYKFNCYVINGSNTTLAKVCSISLKYTGAEKPVFDIATTYNISTVDASASDSFLLNPDSKNKNLLNLGSDYNNSTYRIARIRNANINGKLTDFTKIFGIDDECQGLKFRNDDSDYSIKKYANTVVYGYVECAYKDKLGKEYTVYKLIGVGIKGFALN